MPVDRVPGVQIGKGGPDEDPAEVFLDLASWYVENAVLAAKPGNVRRMAAQLAQLAPGGRRRWVEQLLRQTAALVTASVLVP